MNIIEVKDFSFSYPDQRKEALVHASMEIQEGTLNVICGRSGCGKSTLLRQMKSVLAPHGVSAGSILFKGKALNKVDHRMQSSEIGYVMQNPDNQIVTDKVWHELAFGLESLGYDTEDIRLRVAEMASYFGIHQWFYKSVEELSGGQKQLLNLASVMAMHPSLLILDEPTSQLDPIAASDFLATVRKINRDIGTTVIITEHRLQDIIPYADKVFVMDKGSVFLEGTPREVGQKLKAEDRGIYLSMPEPVQIYGEIDNDLPCPLTVSEGRIWISNYLEAKKKSGAVQAENPEHGDSMPESKEDEKQKTLKSGKNSLCAIELKDVWFRYEKDSPDVIRNLSLKVDNGEFYALVGGNGTGKSTTLSLVSRVRQPYRGRIYLDGRDIRSFRDKELYNGYLGVLPQDPQSIFLKKTVLEDLYSVIGGRKNKKSPEYPIDMKKEKAIEGIVSLTKLEELLERHPYDLSGGEQQRLALAKVLLLRPRILLLDEPTKGMDAEYKQELGKILNKLQQHGMTVFMISHDVEFVAEYADRVGLFFEGNVITSKETRAFFAGNNFYTTAANRMARQFFPDAVTGKDVVSCLKKLS
ncbi:ABC transporter ATP-binding protein [Blautia obeum]|uniref:ATPase components of various ABC-type transport systems, contain duplicated ATPase n=1 Tax=Blautia obeum A2-162 TaxID=657314 RepID=D4LS05_9FIRM|nr:ABC transporter ATP-binding protein [Blautia obeum]RHD32262.1 ATP-binding cassette domain-containing protein [Blautia obeum]CBL23563.1 ATPase components of various ABC-type transport systems, contain duplicated ATPase [Blautia obeum A2-162]